MTPEAFRNVTRDTAVYPEENALPYLSLGLVAEAGEVAGKLAKGYRGDYDTEEKAMLAREGLKGELGDLLWFIDRLADELDWTIPELMHHNASKLLDRSARGVIKGNGDNR